MFFFFSSRRRHTRYWRDWSSDVCSSDLAGARRRGRHLSDGQGRSHGQSPQPEDRRISRDRKSTRLNSSHANISYAVFCLKKKKKKIKSFDVEKKKKTEKEHE